jgi:hypothetical protein
MTSRASSLEKPFAFVFAPVQGLVALAEHQPNRSAKQDRHQADNGEKTLVRVAELGFHASPSNRAP